MTRQDFGKQLALEINLVPEGKKNRSGTPIVPQFITIHNTDNKNKGADAQAHGKFVTETGYYVINGKRSYVSWHYTVDDKRVVKHLPVNEKALHAGSAEGNMNSIGIEICMNRGINQDVAFLRAARLCAALLFDLAALNKDVNHVVPHKHWSGKNCPVLLLDNGTTIGVKWNKFLKLIQRELNTIDVVNPPV